MERKHYLKGLNYHVKNVVVKVVQVATGVFVGVAMNDALKKYVVEPLQKKIDKGKETLLGLFFAIETDYIMKERHGAKRAKAERPGAGNTPNARLNLSRIMRGVGTPKPFSFLFLFA